MNSIRTQCTNSEIYIFGESTQCGNYGNLLSLFFGEINGSTTITKEVTK